jgi:hypothetical protein
VSRFELLPPVNNGKHRGWKRPQMVGINPGIGNHFPLLSHLGLECLESAEDQVATAVGTKVEPF